MRVDIVVNYADGQDITVNVAHMTTRELIAYQQRLMLREEVSSFVVTVVKGGTNGQDNKKAT